MNDTINTLDLVRYDSARNCFVLKGNSMHTWEDGTIKSTNNAFNWRETTRETKNEPAKHIPARSQNLSASGSIGTYTKAKAPATILKGRTNITYSRKAKK